MPLFPAYLDIAGQDFLVVGGGKIAAEKIEKLLQFRPRLTVIAPKIDPAITEWASQKRLRIERRAYRPGDIAGRFMVIVAADDVDLQMAVKHECEQARILCNVVDVPSLCDFIFPALVVKGDIVIGISTSGQGPALAAELRRWLEKNLPPDLEKKLETIVEYRRRLPKGRLRQVKVIELTRDLMRPDKPHTKPKSNREKSKSKSTSPKTKRKAGQ